MPFERATIEIRPASIGTGIKISLRQMRSAPAKMSISLSGDAKKAVDLKNGDKVEVLLGTGSDHGLLRLRKNNSVGQTDVVEKKAHLGDYLKIALGHQPAFVDRGEVAQWCRWELVDDGWLEIVLPKWADETAPKRNMAGPTDLHRPVGSPKPKRGADVTGSIMGDPAPGRSALDARK